MTEEQSKTWSRRKVLAALGTAGAAVAAGGMWKTGSAYSETVSEAVYGCGTAAPNACSLNVKDFGAVGDGVADDTESFRQAIRACVDVTKLDGGNRKLCVPTGIYRITDSAVFSDLGSVGGVPVHHRGGITVEGENRDSSIILLEAPSEDRWIYDNGATARLYFCTYAGLTFKGSGEFANGFKLTSSGHEQAFRFFNCRFTGLRTAFRFEGTGNADRMKFYGCFFSAISDKLYHINNSQSVCHEFYGCEIDVIQGHGFFIDSQGGGDIQYFGGSVVMRNKTGDTNDHYLVYITPSARVGYGNDSVSFYGMRTELHNDYAKLVYAPFQLGDTKGGTGRVFFNECNFFTVVGNEREVAVVGANRLLAFQNSRLSNKFTYRVGGTTEVRDVVANQGEIRFTGCNVPDDLSAKVTFESGMGYVSANHCMSLFSPSGRKAIDFDLNWQGAGLGETFRTKHVTMKSDAQGFPISSGTERTVLLPVNAIIKSIKIKKNASGSSTAPYQLKVGNDDKTVVYGASTAATMMDEHTIYLDNLFIVTGTDTTSRTMRLWSDPVGGESQTDGFAIVEYI